MPTFTLRFVIAILAPTLILASCAQSTTPSRPTTTTTVTATANTQYVTKTSITQLPKLAYLSVDSKSKITGRADDRGYSANVDLLKEQAVYNALKSSNADVLVEPSFKVTVTEGNGTKDISVEVNGFAGKYTEIRNINKDDEETVEMIKTYNNIISVPNSNIKVVTVPDTKTTTTTTTTAKPAFNIYNPATYKNK